MANLRRLILGELLLMGLPDTLFNVLTGLDDSAPHLPLRRNSFEDQDRNDPVKSDPDLPPVTRIAARLHRTNKRRTSDARRWVVFARPRQS